MKYALLSEFDNIFLNYIVTNLVEHTMKKEDGGAWNIDLFRRVFCTWHSAKRTVAECHIGDTRQLRQPAPLHSIGP